MASSRPNQEPKAKQQQMEKEKEKAAEVEEISEGEEEVSEEEEEVSEEEEEEEVIYEEVSEEEEEKIENDENPNPNLIPDSIIHLQNLHSSLSTFLQNYTSLTQTLDSISTTLDSISSKTTESLESLDSICKDSLHKPLRKYISTHIQNLPKLRREIPPALSLSVIPAKFILNTIGKFYIRGSKAYEHDGQAIEIRRVSILLLEFYLMAGCPVGESEDVGESAREVANVWRARLVNEGGVESASPVDALGLVLFMGCFGVPEEFGVKDLYWLLRLSNLRKKGEVLKKSKVLVDKMPAIIKGLITKEMHVEAVDLICTFGLEDKFMPIPLLSSVVEKSCEAGTDERKEGRCSLRSLKEANEKQLLALKSVVKCIEEHKLDDTVLAKLRISQKIDKYEKEITKIERKLWEKNVKRKIDDVETMEPHYVKAKQHMPYAAEASFKQTQEQGISTVPDPRYAYNGYTAETIPVTSETSRGLVAQNVQMLANAWHGNAAYPGSTGQSMIGASYASAQDYARYSAAAGQSYFQPPSAEQNYYQPPAAAGQNYYQPPAAAGQNYYQPAVADQNQYQATAPNGGWNVYEFVDSAGPNIALPTAHTVTNTSH